MDGRLMGAAPTAPAAPYYDALETRDLAARESALMAALPLQLANARDHTDAFAELLDGHDLAAVSSRAALATLPVTRKSALLARQQSMRALHPDEPFGGFSPIGWTGLRRNSGARRVFQSPGTIYEPEGPGRDYSRMGRALHAAGLRAGELVHNSFSYHLTPAGAMME
ncbi:MAG: hypothetical protein EOP35_24650, partial [Rubrivivax sp.]